MSFVAVSQTGRAIASDAAGSPDDMSENLTIWSWPDGRLIRRLPVRPDAISSDWNYYASANGVGRLGDGRPIVTLGKDVFALHAFDPRNRFVVEAASGKGVDQHIRILSLPQGRVLNAFGHLRPSSMALSADGALLATGHWQVVTLWNVRTGKRVGALHGFNRYVGGLSFSRDGGLLAASDGGGVEVWNVRRRRHLYTVDAPSYGSDPIFSPNGRWIAIGGYGAGTVSLIDVRHGRLADQFRVSGLGCGSAAFSPDGRYLFTPSTGGLVKWPYDRGGTIRAFRIKNP